MGGGIDIDGAWSRDKVGLELITLGTWGKLGAGDGAGNDEMPVSALVD